MTDRELLEAAAKAAGIDLDNGWWRPLDNDGDALRLAVKLDMEVYQGEDEGRAAYASGWLNGRRSYCIEYHDDLSHKGDPYAATRRAIVRAAAEIGRAGDGQA